MIEIFYDSIHVPDLLIELNNQPVNYSICSSSSVTIDQLQDFGFNHLKIRLLNDQTRFKITDVRVAGQSVRQTLNLSYVTHDESIQQPATEIWEKSQVWTLPFIYPISTWISVVDEKFPANSLGKNLFDEYMLYFPERILVDKKHIPVVRDFFEYDFDFVAIKKTQLTQYNCPFEKCHVDIDSEVLYHEIYNKLDFLRISGGQTLYNMAEDPNFDPTDHWFTMNTHRRGQLLIDPDLLPKTIEFLNNFEHTIDSATISVTPPGGYAVTHIDKRDESLDSRFRGCKQLYIPLNYPAGAVAKLHRVGAVPLEPVVFNPQYYSHAVVNDSDQHRIVLSIVFDYCSPAWNLAL
jgi:hypothetical protein